MEKQAYLGIERLEAEMELISLDEKEHVLVVRPPVKFEQ